MMADNRLLSALHAYVIHYARYTYHFKFYRQIETLFYACILSVALER